jgi:hypothetical protein
VTVELRPPTGSRPWPPECYAGAIRCRRYPRTLRSATRSTFDSRSRTSPNTEKRDRGIKLDDYRLLPSIREYLIVSHVRREVEIWSRSGADGEWTRRVLTAGESVELDLGVGVAVDDLYREPLPPR